MKAPMHNAVTGLAEASELLAAKIETIQPGSGWHRVEQVVSADIDPLSWLAAGEGTRIFWSEREAPFMVVAGQGVALRLIVDHSKHLDECLLSAQQLFQSCPGARFYGGLAFSENTATHWPGFGGGELILPRFEMLRTQQGVMLVCNVCLEEGARGESLKQELCAQARAFTLEQDFPRAMPAAELVGNTPKWSVWGRQVASAQQLLEDGTFNKVVLSREQVLQLTGELCPWSLLAELKKVNPDTYGFGFMTQAGDCFFGASPERLYRRINRNLDSEALAGTAPRGATPAMDCRLASSLLQDDKNRRENALVLKAVCESLEDYCESVELDQQMSLLQLRSVQHLRQTLRTRLKADVSDGQVLEALHPTPAVGGYPVDKAVAFLSEMETHKRGWYAGPFGCVGKDQAEFAVAIRSALLQDDTLKLYSGAGLVIGSCADAEWAELDSKLRTIQSLLKVDV